MPTADAVACALCGLPAGAGPERLAAGRSLAFCCPGCAEVYALFDRRGRAAPLSDPDPPAHGAVPGATLRYRIGGMWCASCAWGITRYLRRCPGVCRAAVDFASGRAEIEVAKDDAAAGPRVEAWIRDLGYEPLSPAGTEEAAAGTASLAVRAGLALFLGMGVMTLSWAMYAERLSTIWPWLWAGGPAAPTSLGAAGLNLLDGADAVVAALAVFICGWPILRSGVAAMLRRIPNADSLFTLSALSAYALSCLAWWEGRTAYFDVAAMLIAFLLAGRWLQTKAQQRARRERDRWRPASAPAWRAVPSGRAGGWAPGERIAAEFLRTGDAITLRPGETVPADARLVCGWLDLDESSLTGESHPVRHIAGDPLLASAQVLDATAGGAFAVVWRPAAQSLRGQITARVESGLRARLRGQGDSGLDRAAQVFIPVVLGLVAATYLANLWLGVGPHAALWRAVTLLIFACPCTLGLAVPLLEDRAVTQAATHGILVQDLPSLPRLSRCRTVVLDKTGTVTVGRMAVTAYFHAQGPAEQWLAIAAGLEARTARPDEPSGADHPAAAAIRAFVAARGISPVSLQPRSQPSRGQSAVWQSQEWRLGREDFAAPNGLPPQLASEAGRLRARGHSLVWLSAEGAAVAAFGLADPLRPSAAATVARWRRRGPLWLVSGDEASAVAAAARQLGIDQWRAQADPEEKARLVAALAARGQKVAVIGDGYNDAAALAAADVGMALARGANLPCRAAAITLMHGDFPTWERVFALSRELRRRRGIALGWACGYNAIGLPLAAVGLIGPIGAAAAMLISSMSSLAYALRPFHALSAPGRTFAVSGWNPDPTPALAASNPPAPLSASLSQPSRPAG